MISLLEIIERSREGPKIEEKEWDFLVWRKGVELAKQYKIEVDPEGMLRDDVADDVFNASIELLGDIGMYNQTNNKVIKLEEKEIRKKLSSLQSEIFVGEGEDRRRFFHRTVESNDPVLISGGHVRCSEEIAPKLFQAMAQLPCVDMLEGFIIDKVSGFPMRGMPYHVLGTLREVRILRESIKKAKRPGLSLEYYAIMNTAANYIAALNPTHGIRTTDSIRLTHLPEMKITDDDLASAVAAHDYGCFVTSSGYAVLGGFAGGPESAAIITLASAIGDYVCFDAHHSWGPVAPGVDIEKSLWFSPETIWCTGIAMFAHSRNIHMPSTAIVVSSHEPNSENRWRELAITTISAVIWGFHVHVFRTSKPMRDNLLTPLDLQFCSEVAQGALKNHYKREDLKKIIDHLSPKYMPVYERDQSSRYELLKGNPFEELYDLNTLEPKKAYLEQYNSAKRELEGIGFQF
jgi:methylamine--corrinoid protein Co-methyltransferase